VELTVARGRISARVEDGDGDSDGARG